MNQSKRVNEITRCFYTNTLKCSKGKSELLSHKITKFWIANYCWENSLDFATECEFNQGGRADIVVKNWGVAIEVLGTEKVKDFITKKYPMPVIPVPALISPQEVFLMMRDLQDTNGEGWDYYKRKYVDKLTETPTKRSQLLKNMEELLPE